VFEPLIVSVAAACGASGATTAALTPTRCETFTVAPEALSKLSVLVGSSTPAAGAWSLQVAVSGPSAPAEPIVCGAPGALSLTLKARPKVCVRGTPARNLPGIRPLSGPAALVATSLPAACVVSVCAETALLPSTAPAFAA